MTRLGLLDSGASKPGQVLPEVALISLLLNNSMVVQPRWSESSALDELSGYG
jgi:hypothetical protein